MNFNMAPGGAGAAGANGLQASVGQAGQNGGVDWHLWQAMEVFRHLFSQPRPRERRKQDWSPREC